MLSCSLQKSLLVGARWQGIDLGVTKAGSFHKFFFRLLADIAWVIAPACALLFSSGIRQETAPIFIIRACNSVGKNLSFQGWHKKVRKSELDLIKKIYVYIWYI